MRKVAAAPLSSSVFRQQMALAGIRRKVHHFVLCFLVDWFTNNGYSTGWQDVNDILFIDNEDDKLPKGSGLRKRVAGTMMDAEADFKMKRAVVRAQQIVR